MRRPSITVVLAAAIGALAAAAFALVAVTLAAPAAALAATAYPPYEQGTDGHPFSLPTPVPAGISVVGAGGDESLQLKRHVQTVIGPNDPTVWAGFPADRRPDPRSVYPLKDGHLLICGGQAVDYVKEIDKTGAVVWEYNTARDGKNRKPFSAEPATFNGQSCVLIAERTGDCVIAVSWDLAKTIVWQYGMTDTPGTGINQLKDPFCATQITDQPGHKGNVLIADSQQANRVIEIRSSDYRPDSPDATKGYDADSIVWQYGVTGVAGTGPGHLEYARSPQRLPDGRTLITDSSSKRIICVNDSAYDPHAADNGYKQNDILWSYENGVGGAVLQDPNTARCIGKGANAKIIVADSDAQCVRFITFDDKRTVTGTIDLHPTEGTDSTSPRDARIGPDGALWIADAGLGRVLRVGYDSSAVVQSALFDCGRPHLFKAFDRVKMELSGALPVGTSVSFAWSIDGETFHPPASVSSNGLKYDLPSGASGRYFAYRVTLHTDDPWVTPTLDALYLHYTKATAGVVNKPGGGGNKPNGGGNNGGSGTVTYPAAAAAAAAPGGGTGIYGTGSGSGGYGRGRGSGSSGAGSGRAGAGVSATGASRPTDLQPPVESSGSGSAQSVQGYQTEGASGVSGVPLTAAAGAQEAEPPRHGPPLPLGMIALGVVVLAAALLLPWPFVAARLRGINGVDHTARRYYPPIGPLYK